ncbi:alpha-galactosidase [Luteolibacter arcticus]|uniref:Alpha-galactosidase n=1 Tax=Luteolibacter arcticus TaxID=1581411 RepID=A0ABT3GKC5_9BACT|nr:alpha-galactosidase [Luteolibacter arcticus]MCW1923921.1 alpha-galactosidase [Luteolibacter arcticus]
MDLPRLTAPVLALNALALFTPLAVGQESDQSGAAGNHATVNPLPELSAKFESAYARVEENQLVVGTGTLERRWKFTEQGLATVSLKSGGEKTGREWADRAPSAAADWAHPLLMPEGSAGKLVALTAVEDDDEDFMAKNLKLTAEIFYPTTNLTLRYEVRAFPGVAGLMTQLWIKGAPLPGQNAETLAAGVAGARVDYLPVTAKDLSRTAWGFYNDPNQRYRAETHLRREEALPPTASANWASGVHFSDGKGGVVMLKESNVSTKHGTKDGVGTNTGKFILDENGLQNTGWALTERDLKPDKFQWCWASWTLAYDGGEDEMELALKRFDRARFPSDFEYSTWSFLCGWGHQRTAAEGRSYAEQWPVLKMIEECKATGIDMLLIDDGWQADGRHTMDPQDGKWEPKIADYPQGWAPVAKAAKEAKVKLGLWGLSDSIKAEEMIWNTQQLDLNQFKLDFATLHTYPRLHAAREKSRTFLKATEHKSPITWDITDNRIAYGYYWNREYASMHVFNRSYWGEIPGKNNVYIPSTSLRDYWQLAKYHNLNKWQLMMNNPEIIATAQSDAKKHSMGYCLATTLMGVPEIWSMPHMMAADTKKEFTKTLAMYKPHQKNIFQGYVFPIGDCPNNASWTGFQSIDDTSAESGYLMVFREINNPDNTHTFKLRMTSAFAGKTLQVEDLRRSSKSVVPVGADGTVTLKIEAPADYLFLRYQPTS